MKTLILIHSLYGHIYKLAQAVAEGAREIKGMDVQIKHVPETLSPEIIARMGATEAPKAMEHIPVATLKDLEEADGIIFGTGTRFGNMTAQMKAFLDSTGGLWAKGALVGKVGSVFTSHRHSARWPGIHHPHLSSGALASRHDHRRLALCFCRTDHYE